MIIMLRINFKGTGTEKRRDRRILQRCGDANNILVNWMWKQRKRAE